MTMDLESKTSPEKVEQSSPDIEVDVADSKVETEAPVAGESKDENGKSEPQSGLVKPVEDSKSLENAPENVASGSNHGLDVKTSVEEPDKPENTTENIASKSNHGPDVKTSVEEPDKPENAPENVASESNHGPETTVSKENQNEDYEANVHYENGTCIYTDPDSKCEFVYDDTRQEWVPRFTPYSSLNRDYEFDGKTYTYVDKETNLKYQWNEDKKEWELVKSDDSDGNQSKEGTAKMKNPVDITDQDVSQGAYSFESDTHVFTDPSDGTKYLWDREQSAWFPKVDEDFLARYQMNYGFVDPNANDPKPEEKKEQPPPKDAEKRKAPQEPAWFEVGEETTKVYVSGLPLDITEAEFVELMQKCGLVMRDVDSGKMKVKLYLDPETSLPKGDALCTYIKKESVELALELLDGSDMRGHRISVERAKFTMKGQYDPSLKPKKKRKKDKEKIKKIQEKLFAWMPDKLRGERSKNEKIVIVKNLFQPEIFNKDVKLILEYQQDLREECLKCGAVKKVVIYDRHPEGVAQVNFKEFEAADACIQLLNGRWFGQRKITAELWDGKTRYKITETDEEIKARLAKWEKFLETGGAEEKEDKKKIETKVETEEKESEDEKTKSKEKESVQMESSEQMESENIERDSDGDTRSSVGSDYDTDEEAKT